MERQRLVETRPFPSNRRLVTAALRAGRQTTVMHGLVDVDVTEANRLLAESDPPLSMTAFVVASVARAAARHPEVHAYRDWLGRLVVHHHVDVTTIVEVPTPKGPFPLAHVLRDADIRGVAELTAELRATKSQPRASGTGDWLSRLGGVGTRIPGLIPVMYHVMAKSVRVRQRTGTVAVTAVGMFGGGGGFGIAPLTLLSLQVVVGGISKRPRAVDGRVELRDVLDLTVSVDHNVVDGGPAARFGADLRRALESPTLLGHEPTAV